MIITLENISPCLREIFDIQNKIAKVYTELKSCETVQHTYDVLLQYQKEEGILIEKLKIELNKIIPELLSPEKRMRLYFYKDKVVLSISSFDFICFYGNNNFDCNSSVFSHIYSEEVLVEKFNQISNLFFCNPKDYWTKFCTENNLWNGNTENVLEDCIIPTTLYDGYTDIYISHENYNLKFHTRVELNRLKITLNIYISRTKSFGDFYAIFTIPHLYATYYDKNMFGKKGTLSLAGKIGFCIELFYFKDGVMYFKDKTILIENATNWFNKHFQKGWILEINDIT